MSGPIRGACPPHLSTPAPAHSSASRMASRNSVRSFTPVVVASSVWFRLRSSLSKWLARSSWRPAGIRAKVSSRWFMASASSTTSILSWLNSNVRGSNSARVKRRHATGNHLLPVGVKWVSPGNDELPFEALGKDNLPQFQRYPVLDEDRGAVGKIRQALLQFADGHDRASAALNSSPNDSRW